MKALTLPCARQVSIAARFETGSSIAICRWIMTAVRLR